MSDRLERFKRRKQITKGLKKTPEKPTLINVELVKAHLSEAPDSKRVDLCMSELAKSNQVDLNTISVSDSEVHDFLNKFNDKEAAIDALIEPAFLSLIDGTMRAFKLGNRQGLTATRIYSECKSFTYDGTDYVDPRVDRFTEFLNETDNIKDFDNKSNYNGGVFTREGEDQINMRDHGKMEDYKKEYFAGRDTAEDEYAPGETVYKDNETAFEIEGRLSPKQKIHHQSAETDHITPCTIVCNELKKNKALNSGDIKEILNDESNLAVTSCQINRHKGGITNEKFVERDKENLPDELKAKMLEKSREARASIDKNVNKKVATNVISNRTVQARLSKDAAGAAGHRAIGDAIIFFIRPLHFELRCPFGNGA